MDKDYNIDDILSELKEHREEEKPLEPPQPPISAESADPEPVDEAQIKDNNPEPPQDVSQDTAPDALPEPQRDERQQQNEEVASINIIDVSEDDSGEVEITDGEEEDLDDDPPKPYVSKGSKRRKIAIAVLSVLLALVIAAGATTYLVANNMLNNLDIRHNNRAGKKKNALATNITDEELENWYDELYQLLLFCVLIKDNKERKDKMTEFLKGLKDKK